MLLSVVWVCKARQPSCISCGPKLVMRYGRKDVNDSKDCGKEGNLPCECDVVLL
jgi:hypothetical protein